MYVLLCKDGSFYCGIAKDVMKRFEQHQKGDGAKYTRSKKVVRVLYQEVFTNRSQALKAEAKFKRLSRSQKEKVVGLQLGADISRCINGGCPLRTDCMRWIVTPHDRQVYTHFEPIIFSPNPTCKGHIPLPVSNKEDSK